MANRQDTRTLGEELAAHIKHMGAFVVLLWGIEILDFLVFRGGLDAYGVQPRSVDGLSGILLSPFLHGGFDHLIGNTAALIPLGWFIMLRRVRDFWIVAAVSAVVSGAGIWLVGQANSVHIGASGLIFGLLGYLLFRGLFERRLSSIVGSIIVGLLYGAMIFGVLPGQEGISWEGHLFGFVGGIVAARLMAVRRTPAASVAGAR